jgi:hypothetical protein
MGEDVTSQIDWSKLSYARIRASHAKARLPQLLDDVERGETLIVSGTGAQ